MYTYSHTNLHPLAPRFKQCGANGATVGGWFWAPGILISSWELLFWDRSSDQGEEGISERRGEAGGGQEEEAPGFPGHSPL